MTIRQKLRSIRGLRDYFEATVQATGEHVLLVDVRLKGVLVTGHVWINERAMIRAGLKQGQRIRFLASVKPYHKGYAQDSVKKSYTLRDVAKISVIE